MAEKRAIIEELGDAPLVLPELLHDALVANERTKYLLSLLQVARGHADAPASAPPDLAGERARCGIDDARLDAIAAASRPAPGGQYRIPTARAIVERLCDETARMIRPLAAAGPDEARAGEGFARRLRDLHLETATPAPDLIAGATIAALAGVVPGSDSLHLLVMEVHRALNALAGRVAGETIDGARAYALTDEDRPRVAAFMHGVAATAALKLGHPGLATTATRVGERLVIENDVGTTASHVVVIRVEGLAATVTSADVHLQRVQFFRSLCAGWPVSWEETRAREAPAVASELFYLCSGTLRAADEEDLRRFLAHLGSRLVFLIDWNRARKQLREFVGNARALELLTGAAVDNHGHRGFLELGGAQLVFDAMTAVLRAPFRFGERLDDVLGGEAASALLGSVLRVAAEGLLAGRSHALLRELVRAELAQVVARSGERLLSPAQRHGELIASLAQLVRDDLAALGDGPRRDDHAAAGELERAADGIVVQMRSLVERLPQAARFGSIVVAADDAADALEEAAFQSTLLPAGAVVPAGALAELRGLGTLLVDGSAQYLACLAAARVARIGDPSAAVHDLVEAVERVLEIERLTDEAQRRVAAALVAEPRADARALFIVATLAGHLEGAADALMHAALAARDAVLGSVMMKQA